MDVVFEGLLLEFRALRFRRGCEGLLGAGDCARFRLFAMLSFSRSSRSGSLRVGAGELGCERDVSFEGEGRVRHIVMTGDVRKLETGAEESMAIVGPVFASLVRSAPGRHRSVR